MSGTRFGRLVVEEFAFRKIFPSGQSRAHYKCKCDCGGTTITTLNNLRKGNTKSCGCLAKEILVSRVSTHGFTKGGNSRIYNIWNSMNMRCYNKNVKNYSNYGGRGIRVCDRWRGKGGVKRFVEDMGIPEKGLSIERKDLNGNYSPENCIWADRITQCNNRRSNKFVTLNGIRMTRAQAEREMGFKAMTITNRLRYGWSEHNAVHTPIRKNKID